MVKSLLVALPMLVCAIFALQLLLIWWRHRDAAQGWLGVWASVTTLLYAGHFFYFHRAMDLLPLSDTLYVGANLAVYPLYLIYISQLTEKQPISSRRRLLAAWLSLPLLGSLAVGFLYALMSKEEIRNFVEIYLFGGSRQELTGISLVQAYVHDVSHVVFALLVLGVMVTGIRKIRRYDLKLQDLYADTEDKQLNGISIILWLFVVTSFFSVAVNAVGRPSFDHSLLLAIPSLLFSSLLFGICWIGLETHSFSDEMERSDALVFPNSGVPESSGTDFALLARHFDQLMTDEQMYLMHDLRLDFVVQRLGTNRTYLLAALKQELGMTFNEYVNRRRIAHARQLMKANPSILKSDVAARSGYNSLSAFYRNLKNLSD